MRRRREEKIVEELALQLADLYRAARARGLDDERALADAIEQIPDWEAFPSDIASAQRPNLHGPVHDALQALGIAPALGRFFTTAEAEDPASRVTGAVSHSAAAGRNPNPVGSVTTGVSVVEVPRRARSGPAMRFTLVGRSTVLIDAGGSRILTDPFFGTWGNLAYARVRPPAAARNA